MEYLVTAAEMKRYDTNTIENIGIPGMVLMERAALETFRVIEARFGRLSAARKRVFILAGIGNNGGDGLALARLLCEAGYEVSVQCVGDVAKASEQWKQQRRILDSFPVCIRETHRENFKGQERIGIIGQNRTMLEAGDAEAYETEAYDIMIDALFGVGLSRAVTGEYAQAIALFNQGHGFKVALDIPSGIDSDTGKVLSCAVKADLTVTFGFLKRGLVLGQGREYAGEVIKASIGITDRSFLAQMPELFCYNEEPDVLLPKRQQNGNKGTFGKVLLLAGGTNMAGAAVLAARAAYRAGGGMVKVITAPNNRIVIHETIPEALYGTYEDLEAGLSWADVIVAGPGLGVQEASRECLRKILCESSLPLVLDADALNILAEDKELWQVLAQQTCRPVILTPHVGELSRLMNLPISTLTEALAEYGRQLAQELHVIVAAKDAQTYICRENGSTCVNLCGNSGMATAGSGDVLAGIIGGLLAQGMEAFEAASVGVYLHARAGDNVAAQIGEHACMAGDITKIWI